MFNVRKPILQKIVNLSLHLPYFPLNDQFTTRYPGDYQNKQNIAKGTSQGTSLKAYIKSIGISRGSLEELLEDYKNFATKNRIPIWDWREERYRRLRRYRYFVTDSPHSPLPQNKELATNPMIDVITRTCYLLDQQRRRLEEKQRTEGGFTEKLYQARKQYRGY